MILPVSQIPPVPASERRVMHMADTCCPPYDRTLCGLPIGAPGDRFIDGGQPTTCVVCADLEQTAACRRCGP